MPDPEREEASKGETGSGLQEEQNLENPVDKCAVDLVEDLENPEKSASVKVECGGVDESAADKGKGNINNIGEDVPMAKPDQQNDCIKAESSNVGAAESGCVGDNVVLETSIRHEPSAGVSTDKPCPKIKDLGGSIEEGLEEVNLVGSAKSSVDTASNMKNTKVVVVSDEVDNGSSSESESDTSSASSASSSSSESDSDDEEDEEKEKGQSSKIMIEKAVSRADVKEGEILGSDVDKMVSRSDKDDSDDDQEEGNATDDERVEGLEVYNTDLTMGAIRSKNELVELPPVPPVNVTLQPSHQILPLGLVSSIVGSRVVVEGSEKHDPLSEGSILWLTEKRVPLGLVDEIFRPVKNPYYIVRYNSETEVPTGIQAGTRAGFVQDFVEHVDMSDENLNQKGYDASGEYDEEVLEEVEFSDDEEEAEYMRKMRNSKRKNRKNSKAQTIQPSQFNNQRPPPQSSMPRVNQFGVNTNAPFLPSSSGGPTTFSQQVHIPGGKPFRQQHMRGFPTGFQTNNMPWPQHQNPPSPHMLPSIAPPPPLLPWQQHQNPPSPHMLPSMAPPPPPPPSLPPWLQHHQLHVPQFPPMNPGPAQPPFSLTQPVNSPFPGPPSIQAPMMFSRPSPQMSVFRGMQPNAPHPGQLNPNPQPPANFPGNGRGGQ